MSADRTDDRDPFTRQLDQYWAAWGRALKDALGQAEGGRGQAADAFQAGGPWMAAIHDLARQAIEEQLDSAGMARAWRVLLHRHGLWPGSGAGAFAWTQGPSAAAFAPWLEMPAFGPAREHLERWQQQLRQQAAAFGEGGALRQVLEGMMEAAIAGFEERLRQCEQEGRRVASARALLDLWIDAAEQAWAGMAGSEAFARASARATQAQLELQQVAQAELERFCRASGLPTRSEVDQAHRRIASLERELEELRAHLAGIQATGPAPAGSRVRKSAAPASRARKNAPRADTPAKPAGRTAARRKRSSEA